MSKQTRNKNLLLAALLVTSAGACSVINSYDDVVPAKTDTGGSGDTPGQGGNPEPEGGTSNGTAGTMSSMAGMPAGNGGTGNGGAPATDKVVADIKATPDFVGLNSTLDGSGSSPGPAAPLTYAWSITSVPKGSLVKTAGLSAPTKATTTFVPDLAGDYAVALTVTNNAGEMASSSAKLTVPAFDVPYFAVSGDMTGSTRTPTMVKSDSTGSQDLGCFFTENVAGNDETNWLEPLGSVGQFDIDSFYSSDPAQPSRLAFIRLDPNTPGNRLLQLASSATDCTQKKPAEITAFNLPRFSPDGSRIAFFTGLEVATATSDGTGIRIVRPAGAANDHTLTIAAPFWVDNATIGWLEKDSTGDQVIYTTPDQADGFNNLLKKKTLINCGDVLAPFFQIRQLAVSASGLIASVLPTSAATTTSIYLLKPVAADKYSCLRTGVSNARLSSANSQDFQVSPDGTQVVFMQRLDDSAADIGPLATQLFVVPADGSKAPTKVFGDGSDANNGARWAANGKQIVWSRNVISNKDPATQRPQKSFLMIMNADGSNVRAIVASQSNVSTARTILTGAHGCSMSRPRGGAAAAALALLLGLGLWRRRAA